MRHRKATVIVAASLLLAFFESRQALAQDEASQVDPALAQLQNTLKIDDTLTVTSDNGTNSVTPFAVTPCASPFR